MNEEIQTEDNAKIREKKRTMRLERELFEYNIRSITRKHLDMVIAT